jgi:hypothetical protein
VDARGPSYDRFFQASPTTISAEAPGLGDGPDLIAGSQQIPKFIPAARTWKHEANGRLRQIDYALQHFFTTAFCSSSSSLQITLRYRAIYVIID